MQVALFHGRGLISALIRWQTRGIYSHAAIVDDDGSVYEAWQGKGVQHLPKLADGPGVHLFHMDGITVPQKTAIRLWCQFHVNEKTGYDYIGVLRFLTRRRKGDNKRLFCSELVVDSCADAGYWLFSPGTPGYLVSPDVVAWSPKLAGPYDRDGNPAYGF